MPGLQHRWEEEEGEEEEEKEEEGCILRSMPSDPHACLLSGPPLGEWGPKLLEKLWRLLCLI